MANLSQETLTLERFLALLQEENLALIGGDTDTVMRLADQKLACADALRASVALNEALAIEREAHALYPTVRAAQTLNTINGALIQDRLQILRGTLTRVQSLAPSRAVPEVYGHDGSQSIVRSRSLGSA